MNKPLERRSFNAGEIAPTLYWRSDIDKTNTACKVCKNFFVHPHGAIYRRTGFVRWVVVDV